MTHALAIARRDLAERTSVFIAAAVLAVLPFVLTLVPGMTSFSRTDVITTMGTLLAVGFTLGLALVLGVTMIGRDLSEKRMSFYFSKPISAPAIWFGKLAAAILSLAICFTVLFVPSYLAGATSWQKSWNVELPLGFAIVGIAALALLLLGHVFGTMFRSKSPLVALDVALMAVAGLAVVAIIRPLLEGFAMELAGRVMFALGVAVLVILLVCGAWQLSRGRADRKQNHVALSRFVWISMAIVLAIGGAFAAWVVTVSPGDLESASVSQPEQGTWSFVYGKAKNRMDYNALFAYDLATGDSIRIDGMRSWWSSGFSRDGKHVVYMKLPGFRAQAGELYLMPLRAGAKAEPLHIDVTRGGAYTFSDDGARIALIDPDGILSVHDLASKKALVAAKIPVKGANRRRFFFAAPDVVRVYVQTPQYGSIKLAEFAVEIYEVDLRTRALTQTGSYRCMTKNFGFTVSADGTRALTVERDDTGVSHANVIDARTGQLIAPAPAATMMHVTLLADGSVATLGETSGDWTLTVHRSDGSERRTPIGKMERAYFVRQLAGDRLVIAGKGAKTWSMIVADHAHGSIVRREEDAHASSFGYEEWYGSDPRRSVADPAQPIAMTDSTKALYAWQPLTGAKKRLVQF
jgi:ABC-type transport system involved in multi-copper enzyme maturation permease subunit